MFRRKRHAGSTPIDQRLAEDRLTEDRLTEERLDREPLQEGSHEHGRAADAEKTLREGIAEAAGSHGEHLREDTPDEPGKPEAVNLERDEPVTNAARRRDSF